jgi:hypothetical protein
VRAAMPAGTASAAGAARQRRPVGRWVAPLWERLSALWEGLAALRKRLSALRERVATSWEGFSALRERVATSWEGLAALREGFSALRKWVAAPRQRLAASREGFSTLWRRLRGLAWVSHAAVSYSGFINDDPRSQMFGSGAGCTKCRRYPLRGETDQRDFSLLVPS